MSDAPNRSATRPHDRRPGALGRDEASQAEGHEHPVRAGLPSTTTTPGDRTPVRRPIQSVRGLPSSPLSAECTSPRRAWPVRRARLSLQRWQGRDLPSTYYVASTGSDSAAGSAAAPWKTLQKAANTLAAGDTVHVTAGTYVGFNRYGKPGGSAAAP